VTGIQCQSAAFQQLAVKLGLTLKIMPPQFPQSCLSLSVQPELEKSATTQTHKTSGPTIRMTDIHWGHTHTLNHKSRHDIL
jgi:hypothetical protein